MSFVGIISVIYTMISYAAGVLPGWLVRSFRDPGGTNLRGSDMDHKGGDVSHGIIAPSRDYSPSSHINPRFPRDSHYRNIRQPSGFTTHAAPKYTTWAWRKVSRHSGNRTSRTKIEITRIRFTLSKSFKFFSTLFFNCILLKQEFKWLNTRCTIANHKVFIKEKIHFHIPRGICG